MVKYTSTIKLYDVTGPDAVGARKALEEKLQGADLGRWQIISITPDAPPLPVQRRSSRRIPPSRLGPLFLIGAIAWAIWFYWLLLE